jgi:hypothetical protein
MNASKESSGIALLFNLGARWWWVLNNRFRPLYPREGTSTHRIHNWAK